MTRERLIGIDSCKFPTEAPQTGIDHKYIPRNFDASVTWSCHHIRDLIPFPTRAGREDTVSRDTKWSPELPSSNWLCLVDMHVLIAARSRDFLSWSILTCQFPPRWLGLPCLSPFSALLCLPFRVQFLCSIYFVLFYLILKLFYFKILKF